MLIEHVCFIVTILILWFRTNVIYEYTQFIFNYKRYKQKKIDVPFLLYSVYISDKGWIGRLFGCLFCINIWLNIIVNITSLNLFFVSYILSLIVYLVIIKLLK